LLFSKQTNPAYQLLGIILVFSIYLNRCDRQIRTENAHYRPCCNQR